ncbi:hypothetical protein [Rhodococcus rhodochrous]|uniref:hypothetical protein n=1 Tax=Rhodococcus rhodochrous TaxID=1829 RepID=UPI00177F6AC6|nr:hypothetical protein [Rhodococcus rhodochrous]
MERQPQTVADWLRSFEPPTDSSTQLQQYCARVKVGYDFEYQRRGPDQHIRTGKRILAGTLGVDLLATGDYDGYRRWARARAQLVPGSVTAIAARLIAFYETVLTEHRRAAVRQWSIQNTPFHGAEVPPQQVGEHIDAWRAGPNAARLALLEDLLTLLRHSDPATAALDYIQRQAQTVADGAGVPLEVARSSDDTGLSVTLHLPGARWSQAFEPVVEIVDTIIGGAIWVQEAEVVSVTVPAVPRAVDPISHAGLDVVQRVWSDPWLDRVRDAPTDVLLLVDYLPAPEDELSSAQLEELVRAEHALMLCLRTNGDAGSNENIACDAPKPAESTG